MKRPTVLTVYFSSSFPFLRMNLPSLGLNQDLKISLILSMYSARLGILPTCLARMAAAARTTVVEKVSNSSNSECRGTLKRNCSN